VYLRPGDPASFIDARQGFGSASACFVPPDVVRASSSAESTWLVALSEHSREARAQEEQRQAIHRRLKPLIRLCQANGVCTFVTPSNLRRTPFAYQGQVLANLGSFEQMIIRDSKPFLVSRQGVCGLWHSRRRFRQHGTGDASRPCVGEQSKLKLPVLGPTLVPHLSFVGVNFASSRVSEFAFNLRYEKTNAVRIWVGDQAKASHRREPARQ